MLLCYVILHNNVYVQHYTLSKIHKSLENPVGRPIVSGIWSVTEKKCISMWTTILNLC